MERGSTLHQAESLHLVAVSFKVNGKAEGHNLCNSLQPKNAGQRGINDVQHLQQGQIILSQAVQDVCFRVQNLYCMWQSGLAAGSVQEHVRSVHHVAGSHSMEGIMQQTCTVNLRLCAASWSQANKQHVVQGNHQCSMPAPCIPSCTPTSWASHRSSGHRRWR